MQNALMYPFFHRYHCNYGDPPSGSVRRALVDAPRILYQQGIDQGMGGSLDVNGFDCTLNPAGTQVVACVPYPDSGRRCTLTAARTPPRCC